MSEKDSLERLIEIAKTEIALDKVKTMKGQPVKMFLLSENITNGEFLIPAYLFYDRYLNWCEKVKLKPITINLFSRELATYHKKVVKNTGSMYMASIAGFNVSPEYAVIAKRKVASRDKKKK